MSRKAAGWAARQRGLDWETIFDVTMRTNGVLPLKQHPAVAHLGKELGMRVTGPAYVDRVLIRGPYVSVCELKSTNNKNTMSLKRKSGRLHTGERQYLNLKDADEAGTPAYYVVFWAAEGQIDAYRITQNTPWPLSVRRGEGNLSTFIDYRTWGPDLVEELFRAKQKPK